MTISIRELFGRPGITLDGKDEIISVRNSLENHPDGINLSLRGAHEQLLEPNNGNGYARGCRRKGSIEIDYGIGEKEVGLVLPSWVSVVDDETRTVEGVLTKSKVTHTDFPLRPWHTYYDWNFYIRVDNQYTYLNSKSNLNADGTAIMECEWDTAFLPSWAWPQAGSRIWMVGRWIYDCGHPGKDGHTTEIHPPKAVVSFRTEAIRFRGNTGHTRANQAIVYIGRDGGYWQQPINDQDYAFDLYLPPKPYPEAVPRWKVQTKTPRLPVQPKITPYPANDPRVLRVVIPLKNVRPHPESYGTIISAGWSDPHGTEAAKIRPLRVTIEKIFMDANLDPVSKDEWYVYVGVNGRWKIWKSLSGGSKTLSYSVNLDLHPSDQINISVCGFEADEIHALMGDNSGLTWEQICDRSRGTQNAKVIRDAFASEVAPGMENEALGILSQLEAPRAQGSKTVASPKKDYRIRYKVENRS